MVFLRLRVNVLPREDTGVYSFLLPVENPESVTIAGLKSLIQKEFRHWHPEAPPLEIASIVDQEFPDFHVSDSYSVADVFVNKGILSSNSSDQHAIVCVTQKPANPAQITYEPIGEDNHNVVDVPDTPAAPHSEAARTTAFTWSSEEHITDMFDFARVENTTPKQTQTPSQKSRGSPIKTFRQTEEEFAESRSSCPIPEIGNTPESPSGQLVSRKQGREQSPLEGSQADKDHDHQETTPLEPRSSQSLCRVEIPIQSIEFSKQDFTDDPELNDHAEPSKPETPAHETTNALLLAESSLAANPDLTPSKRRKSKKRHSKTLPSTPSNNLPATEPKPTPLTEEKPIPPPREKLVSYFPSWVSIAGLNKDRDAARKNAALEEARKNGAKKKHLRQIEVVHEWTARYNDAIESGTSSRKSIEKLRAEWEIQNDILKEMEEKAAVARGVDSLPRASNGQFAKRLVGDSSAVPTTSEKQTPKYSAPTPWKHDQPGTPKSAKDKKEGGESTNSKRSKSRAQSRVRARSTAFSSDDEYESHVRLDAGDVSAVSTRSQKKRRISRVN